MSLKHTEKKFFLKKGWRQILGTEWPEIERQAFWENYFPYRASQKTLKHYLQRSYLRLGSRLVFTCGCLLGVFPAALGLCRGSAGVNFIAPSLFWRLTKRGSAFSLLVPRWYGWNLWFGLFWLACIFGFVGCLFSFSCGGGGGGGGGLPDGASTVRLSAIC